MNWKNLKIKHQILLLFLTTPSLLLSLFILNKIAYNNYLIVTFCVILSLFILVISYVVIYNHVKRLKNLARLISKVKSGSEIDFSSMVINNDELGDLVKNLKELINCIDLENKNKLIEQQKIDREKNDILENIIRENDTRLRLMDEMCIISETDLKGYITYVNDKFCEVAQYTREELIGKNHNIVRHPDMPKEAFKTMWATLGRGEVFRAIVKNKKKDGTPYYIDGAFAPVIGPNGKPMKYIGIRYENTDVVIEKQSSDGIVHAINDANIFLEINIDGTIKSANENFYKIIGYNKSEVEGKSYINFIEQDFFKTINYQVLWGKAIKGIPQKGQYRLITKSGRKIWLEGVYASVKDDMGRIVNIIKIANDITEQKELELEIEKASSEVIRVISAIAQGDFTQKYSIESKGDLKEMGDSLNETIAILIDQKENEKKTNEAVEEVDRIIVALAEGDLSQRFSIQSSGNLESMGDALNKTIEILNKLIAKVISSADSIALASANMSTSAQELSEGATGQASSVEEISSSMEQMTANIQQNTSNSRQTEKISTKAASDMNNSKESVEATVYSMKLIASKISIIGEISRQTNLLALNAAVEAARAGEHGRGFSVVASEVRKLAERSQAAASEIDEVSHKSVDIAQKSGELLNEIMPVIQQTSDLVQEITASSIEQSAGADQINNAIQNLNRVVQDNAATAEEMAAGAEELSSQAEDLQHAVSFFKLPNI